MTYEIAETPLTLAEREEVARLLHRALVHWYESRLGQGARFGDCHEAFALFPEVYEALDPGECLTARSEKGEMVGVCFTHEREKHLSVGIVATSPDAEGRGVAKAMMSRAMEKARSLGKPVRLVSSLLNLDSFSLYTRLGFVPGAIFQDLLLTVPDTGMPLPAPTLGACLREARPDEAGRLADFEDRLQGIRREKDYAFFLRNEVGRWRVWVSETRAGALTGFLVQSTHPSCLTIGPGVASDEETAVVLLWHALDGLRGQSVVFLVPSAASTVVRTAYAWGARNVELHVAQATEAITSPQGIVFPTFLPETT